MMTVQDLLRPTSRLTYAQFGDTAVQMIWHDADSMTEDQTNADLASQSSHICP